MSIVSDFVTAAAGSAFTMIGAETVTIGADSISCVLTEVDDSREFSEGGFEPKKRLQGVCLTSSLPATSILKKSATARSIAFRVEGVRKGATFTTIDFEEVTKA